MFSKSCQYAIQAILYITLNAEKDKAVGLKEIASSQSIPIHFLSKILQNLVKHQILNSIKGPNGGFVLHKSPKELKLIKIVEIVDGLSIFDMCGIGLKACTDHKPCPIHFEYKIVKAKTKELLSNKTVDELCQDIRNGESIVSYK